MRIKKLDIVGFKSFKDRTVIQFDKGITGIVGPNGCGKSNIVDALVWVMGEMSAKHLRGNNMYDVIFGGSQDYAPSGMAEVSLTLENDGGAFPVKYSKFSEVMVTRRLHRSGESEYLINKEPARLRDIQEIFMDTGAGSKGFSIIEQGKIGEIITAKPLDRRSLIEEAAGITKFKARKRESQRKLISTDQNLVRLQDIIGELKRQIDGLQRQAKRAERYRNLKREIEEIDLWVSSRQYLELKTSVNEAQSTFDEAQDKDVKSEVELKDMEVRLESIRTDLSDFENSVTEKQEAHHEVKEQVVAKEKHLQELKFEMESTRRSEEQTGSLRGEQEARCQVLSGERDELTEKVESLKAKVNEARENFEEKNEVYQGHHSRISEIDQELTDKRRRVLGLAQKESHLQAKIHSMDEKMADSRQSRTDQESVLNELQGKEKEFSKHYKKTSDELESQKQLHLDMTKDVESFEANRQLLTEKLEEKRSEVDGFKDQLNEVTSLLYGLENLQSNFEGFDEGVKSVMFWQKERVERLSADGSVSVEEQYKPVSEVVEVPSEYEVAMEAALGTRLQTLLSESDQASLEAVDYLKSQETGRSSFISAGGVNDSSASTTPTGNNVIALLKDVVKAPEKFSETVTTLLDGVAVVDSVRTALELRPQHEGWNFVTLDGDVLSADGVLTGGAKESAESGVLKRKREIKDLSQRKEEWSGKLNLAKLAMDKLEEQLKQVVFDWEECQKRNVDQEIRVAELKKDVERARTELAQAEVATRKQSEELERLLSSLQDSEKTYLNLQEDLTQTTDEKAALEESVDSLQEELTSSKLSVENLQNEVTELKVHLGTKAQELEGLEKQLEMVARSLTDLQGQVDRMNEESLRNNESLSSHQLSLQTQERELEKLIVQVEETRVALSQAKDQYEQNATGLRELEAQVNESIKARGSYQSSMNEARLKLEQASMKEDNLIEHVREKYMVDLSQVAEEHAQRDGDAEEAATRLEDLKTKISKIGEVNLSAIDEFEETQKRYEFLSEQHQDLLDAKEQLRKVIERINRICSKRFKETFEAVNGRFQTVFPVLFGGGEAKLVLIEDPEKDEMGIDIVAKPPGKKLQSISLMSGGEKALTAVSLIFSIFLVKPSPYCLLDEVDAPLDDANVARFNDLVTEMSKRSQIIVVTHNRYTMEVARKLYGVTMQERGVSKMVSVALNDVESFS